jgi:hypothetical protein
METNVSVTKPQILQTTIVKTEPLTEQNNTQKIEALKKFIVPTVPVKVH